jgi:hypothetical protein
MLVAASGWWFGSIIFIVIWILIAFWPARVAAGIRAQLLRLLHVQPDFLSESGDH